MKPTDTIRTLHEILRHITVEPIMFIVSMTTFIRIPTNQLLILHKVCLLNYNATVCSDQVNMTIDVENDIQADAAYWNFYLKMALLIPGATVTSLYGPLSDKLGRRLFLIIPSVGNVFGAIALILQSQISLMPLEYLIASEFVVGLSGNVVTTYVVAKSYLCDITDRTNRTKRLGVVKSMSYFGGPLGAFLSGILVDREGFTAVYYIIVAIHAFIIIYVAVWLEETQGEGNHGEGGDIELEEGVGKHNEQREGVEQERDKTTGEASTQKENEMGDNVTKEANVMSRVCSRTRQVLGEVAKGIENMLLVSFRGRVGFRRKHLIIILLIGIIHSIGSTAESDLTVLYAKHSPLNWSATTIGIFFTLRTILKALTLSVGLPLFLKLANHHSLRLDLSLASFGIVSTTLALVVISFAQTTTVMMIAPFIGMFVGFPSLILNAIKSKLVEPYEYGALFAFTALVQTLTSTAGTAMFSSIYAASLTIWPGLAFMVTALIYVVSLGLITYLWFDMKKAAEDDQIYKSDDGSEYEKVDTVDDGESD